MKDEALAVYINLTSDELAQLKPEVRERLRQFAQACVEVELYDQGLAPLPPGVIACGPKQIKLGRP